jgi:hypothetical protein
MSDERLDRLIDDVAKQLTAGQPSSDFRARVIASLDRILAERGGHRGSQYRSAPWPSR